MFTYFGSSLNHLDCEMLSHARIRPELRVRESALQQTKWFDYRRIHPVKATYLYAAHYQDAVQALYARTKDLEESREIRAFTPEDVFKCGELVGFWRARQELDAIGVRYEFALRFAMNRFSDRGWRFFPRPNQMLGEEFVLDARDAWANECKIRLQIATDPWFRAENFCGAPEQNAYQKWLVDQIKKRPMPHLPIASLIKEGVLIERVAEALFGTPTVKRARAVAATLG
jgi:hypothetical protein